MKIQATSIAFKDRAYLITGDSGIGKSSLALALIRQGATLIADDISCLESDGTLIPPIDKKGWIEVRGIGLVSGLSTCEKGKLCAVINLRPEQPERTPDELTIQLSGQEYPLFFLWAQDVRLVEKFWVIDNIIAHQMKLETRKDLT